MIALPSASEFRDQKVWHYTDNKSLLCNIERGYSERLAYLQRAMKLRTTFLTDCSHRKLIESQYVATDKNYADALTKPLNQQQVAKANKMQSLHFGDGCGKFTPEQAELIDLE